MATLTTTAALAACWTDRPGTGPLTPQACEPDPKLASAAGVEELAAEPANTATPTAKAASSAVAAPRPETTEIRHRAPPQGWLFALGDRGGGFRRALVPLKPGGQCDT